MRILLTFLFLSSTALLAQQVNIDSLWQVWNDESKQDTVRYMAIESIIRDVYMFQQPDSAYYFAQLQAEFAKDKGLESEHASAIKTQGISFAIRGDYEKAMERFETSESLYKKINDEGGLASIGSAKANIYLFTGRYNEALESLELSLKIKRKQKDETGIAACLITMGNVYTNQGNQFRAIQCFSEALEIFEELDDQRGISTAEENIGYVYENSSEYQKSLDHFLRSLEIRIEMKIPRFIGQSHYSLASVYLKMNNYASAKIHLNQCISIRDSLNDFQGKASALNTAGLIAQAEGDLDSALYFYNMCIDLFAEIGSINNTAYPLSNISSVYLEKENYQKAYNYGIKAYDISQAYQDFSSSLAATENLYKAYKGLGKYKQALFILEEYIVLKDSSMNEDAQREIIRQEYRYEYQKDSIKTDEAQKVYAAELSAEKAENKQNKLMAEYQEQKTYVLFAGLTLALLFGGFIFNRFKVTSKQKEIIEEQKEKVDEAFLELGEKNQEILDSIQYAKRIQLAILPPIKVVKEYLKESFILYKPKDIVAGDFFWLEQKDGKILFAAADCTGHGVPGAMVSVVCNNGLNRSVREHGLTEPGEILDKTREIVIQEFKKSEEDVKDGMDIALCSLEHMTLKYAGAHNPLWIIRDNEIIETKGNNQPIGKFDQASAFTTHTFELQKNDAFYIFSDGFVDQFGGEKGKKFKAKAFRELLLGIQEKSMEEQKTVIDQAFETWRGSLEQIDDVCVIGIKV